MLAALGMGLVGCAGDLAGEPETVAPTYQSDVPPVPQRMRAEICGNGLDDNRDGQADELCACETGRRQRCFIGNPALAGIGPCTWGSQECRGHIEIGYWSPCEGSGRAAMCLAGGDGSGGSSGGGDGSGNGGGGGDGSGNGGGGGDGSGGDAGFYPDGAPRPPGSGGGGDGSGNPGGGGGSGGGGGDGSGGDAGFYPDGAPRPPNGGGGGDGSGNPGGGGGGDGSGTDAGFYPDGAPRPPGGGGGGGGGDGSGPDAGFYPDGAPRPPGGGGGGDGSGRDAGVVPPDTGRPPVCTCVPSATRWCDTPERCAWGLQTCLPDGRWGRCIETNLRPRQCQSYFYDTACCVRAGFCCENYPINHNSVGASCNVVMRCM